MVHIEVELMDKVVIYVNDINHYEEIRKWLTENIGLGNWKEWIPLRIEGIVNPEHNRRTFSFENPEHEVWFKLRWL